MISDRERVLFDLVRDVCDRAQAGAFKHRDIMETLAILDSYENAARAAPPPPKKEEPDMLKFKTGQELTTRSIGDHDCVFKGLVTHTTGSFVTVKMEGYVDLVRVKIMRNHGAEYCFPLGRYSMAPVFRAPR